MLISAGLPLDALANPPDFNESSLDQIIILAEDGYSYTTQVTVEAGRNPLSLSLPGSAIPSLIRFLNAGRDSNEQEIDPEGRLEVKNQVLLLRFEHQYSDEIIQSAAVSGESSLRPDTQQDKSLMLSLSSGSLIESSEPVGLTSIAWVFPAGFEVLSYSSDDPDADWSLDQNKLEYTSKAQQAQALQIHYRQPYSLRSDADGDGLPDDIDECPATPLGILVDHIGCALDFDKDGVANPLDQCPKTALGVQVDSDGCEPDSDRDGVKDTSDHCANTQALVAVDAKGCAVDTDGDGVPDFRDTCPTQEFPTTIRTTDFWGCQIEGSLLLGEISFKTGTSHLNGIAREVLDKIANAMLTHSQHRFEIAAHTDSSGLPQNNESLSLRRATVVRHYLMLRGIEPVRLDARGYGEAEPIADNSTVDGRNRNRRIEIIPLK